MIRGWTFRAWAPFAVVVALVAAGPGIAPSGAAQAPDLPEVERGANPHPGLATSLHDDLAAGVPVDPMSELDLSDAPEVEPAAGTPVTVVVEGDPAAARAAVEAAGGTVTIELEDRVQADVLATALLDVADAPGVDYVREPVPVVPMATSEGVGSIGAAAWQGAGSVGTGVKVAILDIGFQGYASRIGPAGELGDQVTTDFSRCPVTSQTGPELDPHGTAVAEIVHDVAPAASLHLVCINSEVGFISALQAMQAAGVDVVNGSIGIVGAGRGDGSGAEATTVAGAVRALRRQGILYVASAGNYGGRHFHTNAVGDGGPDGTDFVNITANDSLSFSMPGAGAARLSVTWDQWTGPRTDFDVYVYHPSCGPNFIGGSDFDQTQGAPPVEIAQFGRCGSNVSGYQVYVNRFSGSGTPRMDFYFDGNVTGVESPTGSSMAEPATSESVMTVGSHCVHNGALQPYSSQGPTIDGRVEPDISGPDANSGSVYGAGANCSTGFTGTSAAAPHVAGAAALLLGANPGLDVAELQQMLVTWAGDAADAGSPGRDNAFGAGRLTLGLPGIAATTTPLPFTPMVPVRLYDTRAGTGASESPPRDLPVGPGAFLTVQVRDVVDVPDDAVAVALNVTVTAPTANGHLTVQPGTATPTTSNVNFRAGQTVAQQVTATVGTNDAVRIFNAAGNSDVVVDVTGWYGPDQLPGVVATDMFNAMPAPVRALDTRAGQGYAEVANRTTRLANGETVAIDLDRPGGIPAGATAAIVNLTVTGGTGTGHLTAFPSDASAPTTSNINFVTGQTVANLAVVPLDANGRMSLRSVGTTNVIVDVIGWFQAGVGSGYVALNPPMRVLDTRTGTGLRLGQVGPGGTHSQEVGRYTGVPADAEAVVFGVVAVASTATSHLTVFPNGQPLPTASNLNYPAGATVANAVVAGLGTSARVQLRNAAGSVHLVADVSGYFLDPANVPIPLDSPP
jgi:hypothetical protein